MSLADLSEVLGDVDVDDDDEADENDEIDVRMSQNDEVFWGNRFQLI